MPLYEHYCDRCGNSIDVFKPIHERNSYVYCEPCNSVMRRVISTSELRIFRPYFNAGLGKVVETQAEQKEVDKKPLLESSVPYDPLRAKTGRKGKLRDEDKTVMVYSK